MQRDQDRLGPGGRPVDTPDAAALRPFAADLYRRLATVPGNVVCSPYSIAIALAMARQGARGGTAAEIDAVLHSDGPEAFGNGLRALTHHVESSARTYTRAGGSTAAVDLIVANSLWAQAGIQWEQPFLDALAQLHETEMHMVDYVTSPEPARAAINAWTADRTRDRIPEILPRGVITADTRNVLVNAIYLDAPWEEPFESALTADQPFTRSDGTQTSVATMKGFFHDACFGSGAGWQAARLPYAGGALAMTVVVPETSLDVLEASLDDAALRSMLRDLAPVRSLQIQIPRWKFHLDTNLAETLTALGMPSAFDRSAADFGAMTTQQRLSLDAVVHEAFVAVGEQGTEAAAATAAVFMRASAILAEAVLVADRPFLFVIHDVETATALFLGRVCDPDPDPDLADSSD